MEQALLLLGIDARAAVMHFKAQPTLFFQADGQADVATFGELDGVAEQVQQDLAHPHLVATDRDRPGRVLAAPEFQLALLRHRLHQALHLVEQLPRSNGRRSSSSRPASMRARSSASLTSRSRWLPACWIEPA